MKQRLAVWQETLCRIHPVDKSLLLFMLILLIQSAVNLFLPASGSSITGDIDIVVRTSAAAIFGYFLSANFIGHDEASGQATQSAQAHILKAGNGPVQDSAPRAQIGFSAAETAPDSAAPPVQMPQQSIRCLQVRAATFIGLFCLIALLILWPLMLIVGNLTQLGIVSPASDSVTGTIVQFRDFISGCVGFLIGCPTNQTRASGTEY